MITNNTFFMFIDTMIILLKITINIIIISMISTSMNIPIMKSNVTSIIDVIVYILSINSTTIVSLAMLIILVLIIVTISNLGLLLKIILLIVVYRII